jgi:hypothetical protein
MLSIAHYPVSSFVSLRGWRARMVRFRRDMRGSTVLEVALCAPIVFAMFLCFAEFCFMLEANSAVQHAAQMVIDLPATHGYYADQSAPGAGCGPKTSGGEQCAAMPTATRAWLAQTLPRADLDYTKNAHVCAAWWQHGEEVPSRAFQPSSCTSDYAYSGDGSDALPGAVISVQIVLDYHPLTAFGLRWAIPLSYTATGTVTY